ncbi:lipid II:glycine glycyltransferase FemX [Mesorhizobium mediterraneum]|uniref:lipid II:glycine glycyltransferase FemX n=1 Tax=Mesorhizobium mediterraneum TaxID=43617 RepID=UPI00178258BB|nr:GNAT family N-acetyltransferase [Mesorhizobium mediterraneum]
MTNTQAVALAPRGLSAELLDRLSPSDEKACADFVRSAASGCYLQWPEWPTMARDNGRYIHRYLICRSSAAIVALAVVRLSRLPLNRGIAVVRRGPVTRSLADLEWALPAILDALQRAGACTVVVNPRWEGADASAALAILRTGGGEPLPPDMQSLHTTTGYVDLTVSEERILGAFKQRGRRQLRKSTENGLMIREAVSLDEAMAYEPILRDFHASRGLSIDAVPTAADQWRLTRSGGVFLLSYLNGELVGGHVAIRDGYRAFWLSMASRDIDPAIPKNYVLVWEAMRRMKARGCAVYDMAGMPDPRRVEQAGLGKVEANRSQFKFAFSPQLVELTPMTAFAVRPLAHAILFSARQAYRQRRSR